MTCRGLLCLLSLTCVIAPQLGAQRPRVSPKPPADPPAQPLPQLGDEAPDKLLKHPAAKPCDIGDGRTDPCATLTAGHDRIVVAWDDGTHRITYLYSSTLDTDDDIRAGDVLEINADSPITPFPAAGTPHRFVTADWCDTDAALSGEAQWCAVMVPVRPKSGRVLGFVQSLYLYLPTFDEAPMHRISGAQRRKMTSGVAR